MFDTNVTLVGNVLTEPEFRRVKDDQRVLNFRVASNSRRYDRLTNSWVDGPSLRVRVSCWRRLADNVGSCVHVGDPVIVTGRLFTRDWVGADESHRVSYELNANAVGHDLSRGVDKFTRHRSGLSTSTIEDDENEQRVAGEPAEPMPELNNRALTHSYDEELGGFVTSVERDPYVTDDPFGDDLLSELTSSDDDDPDEAARLTSPAEDGDPDPDGAPDGGDDGGADTGGGETAEPGRKRRRRQPVGV